MYTKQQPFLASIKERYSLTKPGSSKNTQHIILDLRGSGITYQVGDSIGIYPQHDPLLVRQTLEALQATGQELVRDKDTDALIGLEELLTVRKNITDISPKLFREVVNKETDPDRKHELETLLLDENRQTLKDYLQKHEVWDFLHAHPAASFSPQELADLLMPLLPRFYSISSSQQWVGDEVHLTVAPLEYESNGHKRRGVCTHYICQLAELNQPNIPVFLQPSHSFRLPENPDTPLLMIGPGTGIAPFRAFLQERLHHHQSKGKHWLFFGEWNQDTDFYYEEEWLKFGQKGHLRLDLAFSRDQEHKIYVQHKMWEQGEDFFNWLEQGAYLYVCGDAERMAKDVDAVLLRIIQEFGLKNAAESKEYVKRLRKDKRYLRDVY